MADQLVCPVKPKDMPTSARANAGRLTSVGVVEDDADLRRSLIRLIDHATGMRCVGSWPEGASALAEISALKPDVVLMDINMPGMSGIECTARLKQVCPDTQVIMVTVYADSENIFSALQAGACGYLLKRTPSSGIIEAINDVRSGGAPMSNQIARQVIQTFQQPAAPVAPEVELSLREREVLELLGQGFVDKTIAGQLGISYNTVRAHVKHIYEKLHVHSRFEVMRKYVPAKNNSLPSQTSPLPTGKKRQ